MASAVQQCVPCKPVYLPSALVMLKHRPVWLQAELKEELAAKTAAISLLESTVTSLESDLEEKTEEWQGALENLEALFKSDKARLKVQLAALTAEKVCTIHPVIPLAPFYHS